MCDSYNECWSAFFCYVCVYVEERSTTKERRKDDVIKYRSEIKGKERKVRMEKGIKLALLQEQDLAFEAVFLGLIHDYLEERVFLLLMLSLLL